MTIPLLPHFFKYVGIFLMLAFIAPIWLVSFYEGFTLADEGTIVQVVLPELYQTAISHLIGYVGLFVYLVSKDKVHDELINEIRNDSLKIVFFGTLLFIMFRVGFYGNWDMSAIYLFEAQAFFFLTINKIKKSLITF